MTDYHEEQSNEIEALESIYPEEYELLSAEPYFKFKILVRSNECSEEDEDGVSFNLIFQYTSKYPDEAPNIDIEPLLNMEEETIELLKKEIEEQCTENLGMVMAFTIVSFSTTWINERIEDEERRVEEAKRLKKEKEDELERKRFEGTRVTVESFLAWKTKFDDERMTQLEKEKQVEKSKKLNGRELFMRDDTMNESDVSFLAPGEEVAVDESLFQDLEDLDLDEELELSDDD